MKTIHSFYYVLIPDSGKPVFPDLCVVCGMSGAEELKRMQITEDLGSVQFYLYGIGRDREEDPHLYVPIHESCGKGVRNGYAKLFALVLAIVAAIAAFGIVSGYGCLLSFSAAAITAGPLLFILLSKPVPCELDYGGGKLHLKFSNRSYAQEVARLNESEAIEYRQHMLGNHRRVEGNSP